MREREAEVDVEFSWLLCEARVSCDSILAGDFIAITNNIHNQHTTPQRSSPFDMKLTKLPILVAETTRE